MAEISSSGNRKPKLTYCHLRFCFPKAACNPVPTVKHYLNSQFLPFRHPQALRAIRRMGSALRNEPLPGHAARIAAEERGRGPCSRAPVTSNPATRLPAGAPNVRGCNPWSKGRCIRTARRPNARGTSFLLGAASVAFLPISASRQMNASYQ